MEENKEENIVNDNNAPAKREAKNKDVSEKGVNLEMQESKTETEKVEKKIEEPKNEQQEIHKEITLTGLI